MVLTLFTRNGGDDERGASLAEYALLVALIAVVCIGAVAYFGSADAGSLTDSGSQIVNAG